MYHIGRSDITRVISCPVSPNVSPNATLLNLEWPANMLLWDIGCLQEIIPTWSHIKTYAIDAETNAFDSMRTNIVKLFTKDKRPVSGHMSFLLSDSIG